MKEQLIKIILFFTIIFQIACGEDCSQVPCASPGGTLTIKVTRDGKNALFGTDTISQISHDSVRFYAPITDTSTYKSSYIIEIPYDSVSQTIKLNLKDEVLYVLELDTFRRDSFRVFSLSTGMDDCCKYYQLNSASKNGQFLCGDGCHEIIELQL